MEKDMQRASAADELAMIRTRIARLKAREAELSMTLIEGDAEMRHGRWTHARVVERRVQTFDHRLLPIDVQADLLFWREETRREIVLELKEGGPAGSGAMAYPAMDGIDANMIGLAASGWAG